MVANVRAAREHGKHSRPRGLAPPDYPNWNADEGIWYSDDGVPQPSVRERAAQRKRAERERKLLGQLSVLAGGGAHADADGDDEPDDDDDDYGESASRACVLQQTIMTRLRA